MSVSPLSYTYVTQANIEAALSVLGVRDRLDDDADGYVTATEQLRITEAINNATETINFYCIHRYTPANLSTSNWINRRATELACYDLCGGRANPVPDSVAERASKAEQMLELIHDSRFKVPLIAERRALAPSWSSLRAEARYNFRVIRVEAAYASTTEPTQQTTQPQQVSWSESFSVEW